MSETFSVLSVRSAVRRALRQLSVHERAGLSFLFSNAERVERISKWLPWRMG